MPATETLYCECETPLMVFEIDFGCRRCGRPVDFSPKGDEPVTTWPSRDEMRAEGLDPDTGVSQEEGAR